MIEEHVILPRRLIVAVLAYDPLFAFMRVVFGMAIVTGGLQCHFEYWLNVAVNTIDYLVRTKQQVVRIGVVIKYRRCP